MKKRKLLKEAGLVIKALLNDGRPDTCDKAHECFHGGGVEHGWLTYDNDAVWAAGGYGYINCWCASEAQREAVETLIKIEGVKVK